MKKEFILEFEETLEKFKKTYNAQGIALAIFDKDNILYEKYMGYRDIAKKETIDKDTIFGIASITKSFTVISILKLAEKKIIDLNDPITKYLPSLKLPENQQPTISNLMSHSAGFLPQERFLITDFAKKMNLTDEKNCLATNEYLAKAGYKAIVERLNKQKKFTGKPGENFSYSNFSYGLLTEIVRKYGNCDSYCDCIKKDTIFPLELKRTFFDFNRTNKEHNITKLYKELNKKIIETTDYKDAGFVLMGGGGIKSTLSDMTSYTQMYLNNGCYKKKQIISSNILNQMQIPQISYKEDQSYGYGLVLGKLADISFSGHSGGLTGVSSFFGFSREIGKGVVVLCNTENVPVTSVGMMALKLANNKKPNYKISEYKYNFAPWSLKTIKNTVGIYESEEGLRLEITENNGSIDFFVDGELKKITTLSDNLILIKNKMEENTSKILRNKDGQARGIYWGSRIIQRK